MAKVMHVEKWRRQTSRDSLYFGMTVIFNTRQMCQMSRREYRRLIDKAMRQLTE